MANFTPPTSAFPSFPAKESSTGGIANIKVPASWAGAVTASGTMAPSIANITLPMLTFVGVATRAAGDAAITLPMLKATGFSGAGANATLPMIRAYGVATVHDESAKITLPSIRAVGYSGASAAATLPMPQVTITGTFVGLGSAGIVLPAITASGTGIVAERGDGAVTLPTFKAVGYSGSVLSVTIGAITAKATGTMGAVGGAEVTLPMFTLVADGTKQAVGSADITLPALRMGDTGKAWIVLPGFTLRATGSATVTATYEAYAVNLNHTSDAPVDEVTHYTNFPFDRIVRYKNSYFGMNATGLYLLEGTTDNGAPTSFAVQTHKTDFDSQEHKTVVSLYMGGRIGPAENVSIIAGETTPNVYNYTTPRGPLAQTYRQKFGRGIKSRYYAFAVSGSAEFRLDDLKPEINKLTRSI